MAEKEEIIRIVEGVLEEKLPSYLARYFPGGEEPLDRFVLIQHLIRLEEELKAQRQILEVRFEAIDSRFEAIDSRFEAIDRRFEAMDKRFDDLVHYVDRRFTQLTWVVSLMFTVLAVLITLYRFLG